MSDLFEGTTHAPTPVEGVFRGWVPEDHFDEVSPLPKAAPEDWFKVAYGVPRLLDFDGETPGYRGLYDGDEFRFFGLTTYPSVSVSSRAHGIVSILGPVPPEADVLFALPGDVDTTCDRSKLASVMSDLCPNGDVADFLVYRWATQDFVYRNGRFHPIAIAAEA